MATTVGHLKTLLSLNNSKFTKGMKESGKASKRFGKVFSGVAGKIAAGLSVAAITGFTKKVITLAAAQERSEKSLAAALALVTTNAVAQTEEMKRYASSLQEVTTFGDEVILQNSALLVSIGKLEGEGLKRAIKASIGLSKAFGIDLQSSMRLVGRAAVGDTSTLKRYGIQLDTTKTKAEQFNDILDLGRSKFSLATAEVETLDGALKQLLNTLGDFGEDLGEVALPPISENVKGLHRLVSGPKPKIKLFQDYVDEAKITGQDVREILQNDFNDTLEELTKTGSIFSGVGEIPVGFVIDRPLKLDDIFGSGDTGLFEFLAAPEELRALEKHLELENIAGLQELAEKMASINPDVFKIAETVNIQSRPISELFSDITEFAKPATDAFELFADKANQSTPALKEYFNNLSDIRDKQAELKKQNQEDLLKTQISFWERNNRVMAEGIRLADSLRTPIEKYEDSLIRINELLRSGAIDEQTRGKAFEAARKQITDRLEGVKTRSATFGGNAALKRGTAAAQAALFDSRQGKAQISNEKKQTDLLDDIKRIEKEQLLQAKKQEIQGPPVPGVNIVVVPFI